MGDATFTKPIMRWFEKRRERKAAKAVAREVVQKDDMASVREVFELSQRGQHEPSLSEVLEEPADMNQLDLDLVQNVFTRSTPPGQHADDEGGIGQSPELPISRIRIDPLDEESAGEPQAPTPTIAYDQETVEPADRPLQQAVVRDTDQDEGERPPAARPMGVTTPEVPDGQPRTRLAAREVLDSLPVSLKDIFRKKTATNPQVKALLQRHGKVGAKELVTEANDLTSKLVSDEEQE